MDEKNLLTKIEKMIFVIRGQKVMLDSDLAKLYGVETKALNQAVRRNEDRFPSDFMFKCNSDDLESLRSQIVTTNSLNTWNYKRRNPPIAFTENGIAMLSSVLKSKEAIQVNISIMRIFNKLRSFLLLEKELREKMDKLEIDTGKLFRLVFERLDDYETQLEPHLPKKRKKIGLKKGHS